MVANFFLVAALALAAPASASACDLAPAVLAAARDYISGGPVVLQGRISDYRFAFTPPEPFLYEVGDPSEGYWPKVAPSKIVVDRLMAAEPKSILSDCPRLATQNGLKAGRAAERALERQNARYDEKEVGVLLGISSPTFNDAHDEALVTVAVQVPGHRAGSGWIFLLKKRQQAGWEVVDRLFLWVS